METQVESANEAAIEKLPPVFVNRNCGVMEKVVKLEFPLEYDGIVYDEIRIRRPLMREWRNYLAACNKAVEDHGPGADDLIDQPWVNAPSIVLDNLDFMDGSRVEAVLNSFFASAPSS